MSEILHESGAASLRRQSIVEEAALWLTMCSDPNSTEADRAAFVDWLRRSNLHVEEFLRLSAMTRRLSGSSLWPEDTLQELIAYAQQSADVPRIAGAAGSAAGDEPAPRSSLRVFGPRLAAGLAAISAIVVAAFLFVPRWLQPGLNTYTTAVGEIRSIVLPDGSVVELNTRSELRARFDARARSVELTAGEAIFRVARDPARPFRVTAGDTEILAVGTQFNVYAEQARTVVTVLEGRVRVMDRAASPARSPSAAARMVELASGEQAVVAPRKPIARVALADPSRVTSWTQRRLIFEETALAQVAAQFQRYSQRRIVIEDATLAGRQITGVFDANDPESLVQFLAAQGVVVERTREGWTLK